MKRFWQTMAIPAFAAVLVIGLMVGCNQGTSSAGGTGSQTPGSQTPGSAVPPAVSAADITGVWKVTQGFSGMPYPVYAYYEGSGEIIYIAYTTDNGMSFEKLHGATLKFKDGRVVLETGSHSQKNAVKKEGSTLKLYAMDPTGTMIASTPSYILEKDTAHSGWGAKIKSAT